MSNTGGLQPGELGQFAFKTRTVRAALSVCTVYVANSFIDSAEHSLNHGLAAIRSELQEDRTN
jgi:hypothetical protein